jgi:heat-inducible transcriptional repressor
MVMVPAREPRLAQLTLVHLSAGRALAVLVDEDGGIENRVVDLPPGLMPGALEEASNYITARLRGARWARARRRCRPRSPRARLL